MEEQRCTLSIVVVGRNDNYGGNFIERLQTGINWNTRWLEYYKINSEIILVNWNPVAENPDLTEVMTFPKDRKYVRFRMITVPSAIHKDYIDPSIRSTVPMFEFVAKNVGIKRAKGKYLLSINADILIHPEIFSAIGKEELDDKHYYRANRLDYRKTDNHTVTNMLKNGFSVLLKGKMYYFNEKRSIPLQYQLLRVKNVLWLKWEAFKLANPRLSNWQSWVMNPDNGAFIAHCHASGDFMLMATELWMKLKGYPEYTYMSTHTDSIFTMLAYSKLNEKVFKQPIFHQEHERRYAWEAIEKNPEFVKTYNFFEELARTVKANKAIDSYLNDDNWGLVKYDLHELELSE
jgi:glycosyltransferase involved in cell wall biosynthesis